MKKLLFIFLTFLAVNASAQIPYETSVFWQFLEGFQGGDSSTQNYLEYKNDFLLLKTDQRDAKILQARNELNDIGISTIFIDANGNGGIGVDSSNGATVVKLRGALSDHSYLNNTHVSIGRGGQTQAYGGNVDGAQFTVSDDREPGYGLWDANNYQMMLQSSKDSIGGYVGLAFTSENATQDKNVGAFINYRKTGNNGKGELHFGTKTATGSLADGIHAMKIYDGSVTIDSTIILPNLYTGTSDTTLIISNDTIYKKVSSSDNIYTADGTLTGDRTLNLDTYDLTFSGGSLGSSDMTWNGRNLNFNTSSNYINFLGGVTLYGTRGMYKGSLNNGQFYFETSLGGAPYINRNVADANPTLIVENENASSTGDIAQFQNSTGTVASITNDGGAGFGNSSVNASAKVEITSTTKGFLPPRMTGAQAEAISSPAEGLMVYSTDGSGVTITSKGWWGYDGSTWVKLN